MMEVKKERIPNRYKGYRSWRDFGLYQSINRLGEVNLVRVVLEEVKGQRYRLSVRN